MKPFRTLFLSLVFILGLCIQSNAQTDSIQLKKMAIKGFFTTWNQHKYSIMQAPLKKLDEIIVCFAWPDEKGNLNASELSDIDFIVKRCHTKNVKVSLAIGGATKSEPFPVLAATEEARTNFVNQTIKYCKDHKIDGINIDWEHWPNPNKVSEKVNKDIVALFKQLYTETQKEKMWLSFDVYGSDYYGKHYPAQLIKYADELIIMSYDGAGVWSAIGHHSDMALFDNGYAYWLNKIGKENAGKITMAVPFYGIRFDKNHTAGNSATAAAVLYNETLMDFPQAYTNDTLETKSQIIIHNGINTLGQKVKKVKERNNIGIAIWEISFDHGTGKKSLIDFLYNAANPTTESIKN